MLFCISFLYHIFIICFLRFQDELVGSLEQALKSQNIPEITQTLLNLAEFMEHCDIKVYLLLQNQFMMDLRSTCVGRNYCKTTLSLLFNVSCPKMTAHFEICDIVGRITILPNYLKVKARIKPLPFILKAL